MAVNKEHNVYEISRIKNLTNPFEILGIDANDVSIDTKSIKKNYHKLALKVHPDHNNDSDDAKQAFQKLQSAFDNLSDPSEREYWRREFNATKSMPAAAFKTENTSKAPTATNFKPAPEAKPANAYNPSGNTPNYHKPHTNNYTPYGSYYGANYSYTEPAKPEVPQEPDWEAIKRREDELQRRMARQRALDKQWAAQQKARAEQQKAEQTQQLVPVEQGIWPAIKHMVTQVLVLFMGKPKAIEPDYDIKIEVVEPMHQKDFAKFVKSSEKQAEKMQQETEKRIKSARTTAKNAKNTEEDERFVKVKLDSNKSNKRVTFDSKTLRQERRKAKKRKQKHMNNASRTL